MAKFTVPGSRVFNINAGEDSSDTTEAMIDHVCHLLDRMKTGHVQVIVIVSVEEGKVDEEEIA